MMLCVVVAPVALLDGDEIPQRRRRGQGEGGGHVAGRGAGGAGAGNLQYVSPTQPIVGAAGSLQGGIADGRTDYWGQAPTGADVSTYPTAWLHGVVIPDITCTPAHYHQQHPVHPAKMVLHSAKESKYVRAFLW